MPDQTQCDKCDRLCAENSDLREALRSFQHAIITAQARLYASLDVILDVVTSKD